MPTTYKLGSTKLQQVGTSAVPSERGNVAVLIQNKKMRLLSQRHAHVMVEVRSTMINALTQHFPDERGDVALKIDLLAVDEGDRVGRMCCSGLGVGWVVLKAEWQLLRGDTPLMSQPKKEKLRDSGMIGFADCCDREGDSGHRKLLELAAQMAQSIALEAKDKLNQLSAS